MLTFAYVIIHFLISLTYYNSGSYIEWYSSSDSSSSLTCLSVKSLSSKKFDEELVNCSLSDFS